MDDKMKDYIFNDIMVTHIIAEKRKAEKMHKRVDILGRGFVIFSFVTVCYIAALIVNSSEQNKRISELTEVIKELKSAKGE